MAVPDGKAAGICRMQCIDSQPRRGTNMKRATLATLAISVSMVLLFARGASAQDWPQWRGPNRDAKATGFQVPDTWPAELTKRWSVEVGDGVATPALVGDKLYVFSRQEANEIVRCLNAATGEEVWKYQYESRPADGPASRFGGPRSSPTVTGGKVVTLGARGIVSCLDAATGDFLWQRNEFDSWPRFYASSSPLIVDDVCIVQLGGERDGGIFAYDLASGEPKWRWTGDGPGYGSPVPMAVNDTKAVVALTSRNVVSVSLESGSLLWQTAYAAPPRGYNASTPIVDGEVLCYAGSGRGTKAVKLAAEGDKLAASDVWANDANSVQYNSPVLKDGFIYGITNDDKLFCINAETGETAWTQAFPERSRQRGYGSVVDAGSVMVGLNPSSQLVVFEPTGMQYKQLASYTVAETETFAYPILSAGRIFIKDQDSVTLWTTE